MTKANKMTGDSTNSHPTMYTDRLEHMGTSLCTSAHWVTTATEMWILD